MEPYDRETAAATLLPRVMKIARGYARSYNGLLDRDEAESIALVALATALAAYDPERGEPEPFIDRSVRNALYQEVRHLMRRRRVESSCAIIEDTTPMHGDKAESAQQRAVLAWDRGPNDVETELTTLERHEAIVRAIRKVDPQDLCILRMRNTGHTLERVGKEIGMRKQSVAERITKARTIVRAELANVE